MSVIQPMYLYSGKYSAGTVRKHLSSIIQSASDGTRVEGVVPSFTGTNSMKVVPDSGRNLLVKTGLCIIADKATQTLAAQDVDQPGVYIAGVVDTDHPVTIAANSTGSTRYDLVYAEVIETSFVVSNKTLGNSTGSASATNTARLTTSSTHGFVVGQTVIVRDVDETFDGQHVITAVPTTTTFEYAKTASDVVSVAVSAYMQVGTTRFNITNKQFDNATSTATITTVSNHGLTTASDLNDLVTVRGVDTLFDGSHHILTAATNTITYKINRVPVPANVTSAAVSASSTAKAAVPFAVKVLTGTTSPTPALPSTTNSIPLAVVSVANGASTISAGDIADRRVFTTALGGVYIYNAAGGATQPTLPEGSFRYDTNANALEYYDGTAWQIFSLLTLSGTGVSTTAAKSDHAHTSSLFSDHLGSSQVQQDDDAGIGFVFGNQLFSANLLPSKTYIFEAYIPFSAEIVAFSQAISFSINGSGDGFSSANFDFLTWSQTESSSIIQSGYRSATTLSTVLSESVTPSLSAGSTYDYFLEVHGVIRTFTTQTNVDLLLNSAVSNITIGAGAWVRYTNVGDVNQTVINGTWS
jgi:hypothetical protein